MSKERQRLIEELEKQRDSVIMSLVYSNHAEMSDDDAVLVYEVLKQTFEKRHVKWPVERVEMLINSIGGLCFCRLQDCKNCTTVRQRV